MALAQNRAPRQIIDVNKRGTTISDRRDVARAVLRVKLHSNQKLLALASLTRERSATVALALVSAKTDN